MILVCMDECVNGAIRRKTRVTVLCWNFTIIFHILFFIYVLFAKRKSFDKNDTVWYITFLVERAYRRKVSWIYSTKMELEAGKLTVFTIHNLSLMIDDTFAMKENIACAPTYRIQFITWTDLRKHSEETIKLK